MSFGTGCVPITISGRYLWKEDNRFFVRGVAYQIHSTLDPISDDNLTQLEHDLLLFKELGINTVFVYSIDNTKSHAQSMKLLEEAGIYILALVSTPSCAIKRLAPYKSYNSINIASFFKTVDIMANYPNTLGLLVASELVNNDATLSAVPVIKSTVRDLKRYMKLKSEAIQQRVLPIGYDAAMNGTRDMTILRYLVGGGIENSIDFWTCKGYSWAGESSMVHSGYDALVDQLGSTTIPVFFSEYGNNLHQPRLFKETIALYSSQMNRVFSGGCVYEFWQGPNRYGLVEMRRQKTDTRKSYQQDSRNHNKVVETRETGHGLLLIYHDFANYKVNLATTEDLEADWHRDNALSMGEDNLGGNIGMEQMNWPWEPTFQEPEGCIDWVEVEKALGNPI